MEDFEKKKFRYSILYTVVFGFVAHGYIFSNLSLSHDSLVDFVMTQSSCDWQTSLGRFLVPLYHIIFATNVCMPWISGIVALCWIGIGTYYIAKFFNRKLQVQVGHPHE